jgi:uncharacterized protein
MSARFALAALALVAAACSNAPAASTGQLHFPALTGRVVDQADLLSPAEEAALTAQSAAIERDTRAQYSSSPCRRSKASRSRVMA